LSVHQALADPQNGVDDHAHCEHNIDGKPGRQKAQFGSKEVSFFFDGSKCFFEISTITQEEMDTLPRIYIHGQSTKEYVPSIRAHSCGSTQSEPLSNLIRNLPTSGLDSGSSWLDGVNGILMQQEPDLPKQDYWNRRAIASLANTLITVVEPVPMPLLSSMPLLQL
jgi:hypothetical protein